MPLRMTCPRCRTLCQVPDGYAGRQVRCPRCPQVMRVGNRRSAAPLPPSVPSLPLSLPDEPEPGPPPRPRSPLLLIASIVAAAFLGASATLAGVVYFLPLGEEPPPAAVEAEGDPTVPDAPDVPPAPAPPVTAPGALFPLPAPSGWAMAPDQATLHVALAAQHQIVTYDTAADREVRRVDLDFPPGALAVQGATLFAAARGSSTVHALDADTGQVKKSFDLGRGPIASLACHPARGPLFASTEGAQVHRLDPATGAVTPNVGPGYFLAIDSEEGKYLYSGVQPTTQVVPAADDGGDSRLRVFWDEWGRRAVLLKYEVTPRGLRLVATQNNAAVNAWAMHLTPDGRRIMMVGGGGWRPKESGPGGGLVIAVYSTDDLQTKLGEAPHGLAIAFHPTRDLGVVNEHGTALRLIDGHTFQTKRTIPLADRPDARPLLLTFGGQGSRIIVWNGEQITHRQGLHFIPLD